MRTSAARIVVLTVTIVVVVAAIALARRSPRPYVVTAIDYHFHDAHPTQPIVPGRDLVVKNVGRNVHNVTIPALSVSQDVPPGGQLTIEDIAGRLGSGRYQLLCDLHVDRLMIGTIVLVDP